MRTMESFFRRKHKQEKRGLDVSVTRQRWSIPIPFFQRGGRETVNLRQKIYVKYPLEVLTGLLVLVAAVFLVKSAFTKAEVASFNPASCLGTWQNAGLAQGVPETFGVEGLTPSEGNSAQYAESPSYIFCGGFVPADFEATGTIRSVGLTFVWNVLDVSTVASTATPVSPGVPEGEEIPAAEGAASSSEPAQPLTPVPAPEGETSTPAASPAVLRYHRSLLSYLLAPAYAQESPAEPDQQPTPVPKLTVPSATDESVPGEGTQNGTSTSPESDVPTSTSPISEPTASSTEATSSAPAAEEPVTYAPPAPPDENFLKVSYTLDGMTWFELSRVNLSNWPNLTLSIPVNDWNELKNLQVSVEDTLTTLLPPYPRVFLDGMLLEVTYDRPVPTDEIIAEQQQDTETPGSVEEQNQGEQAQEPETQVEESQNPLENLIEVVQGIVVDTPQEPPPPTPVFVPVPSPMPTHTGRVTDPEAQHSCAFDPFTLAVRRETGRAIYTMLLSPSRAGAPYTVALGTLPRGISATVDRAAGVGSARPHVVMTADASAEAGSYTLSVLYHETQDGGGALTTLCKLNLIVE
jgi:hypothetical protein